MRRFARLPRWEPWRQRGLTAAFPPDLMDAVLAMTQDREARVRLLPPKLEVRFVLGRHCS
ncbi:transposase domain-containing protein [Streptomyces sp. NBC_01537]|uniref:transposase domain-containing protein n=1 Tax=Streptomyces sp. NBC_01537 TaxID=2903896 RepID=UPI003868055F